jgi:hypothetical protein
MIMMYDRPKRDWARDRPKSKEFLTLERLRLEMLKASAREWLNLVDLSQERFWTTALPQALYDTLVSFELGAARVAAQAFLEDNPVTEDSGTEGD